MNNEPSSKLFFGQPLASRKSNAVCDQIDQFNQFNSGEYSRLHFPEVSSWNIEQLKHLIGCRKIPDPRDMFLLERSQRFGKYLQRIPFIRLVAVCNSVSMNASHDESDIDLFIVTEPKRLFIARFLVSVLFMLLGNRKTSTSHKDTFCLSFFVTTLALDLSYFSLPFDPYLELWITSLKPIINRQDTYQAFLKANSWIHISLPRETDATKYAILNDTIWQDSPSRTSIFGGILDFLDLTLSKILIPRAKKKRLALLSPEGTIITHNMLKFHDDDKRAYWADQVERLGG